MPTWTQAALTRTRTASLAQRVVACRPDGATLRVRRGGSSPTWVASRCGCCCRGSRQRGCSRQASSGQAGPWTIKHVHRALDEVFYVVEGQFTFTCGDVEHTAGRGSLVCVPRGTPHVFSADTEGGRFWSCGRPMAWSRCSWSSGVFRPAPSRIHPSGPRSGSGMTPFRSRSPVGLAMSRCDRMLACHRPLTTLRLPLALCTGGTRKVRNAALCTRGRRRGSGRRPARSVRACTRTSAPGGPGS
jgi:mannose-6-phosphate isomerase-like protein (cupin superfamily)